MNLKAVFEKYCREYRRFNHVVDEARLPDRTDLCAFLLLHTLVPSLRNMIAGAEHDEIFLDTDLDALAKTANEDDILTLVRCGVRYSDDGLMIFV